MNYKFEETPNFQSRINELNNPNGLFDYSFDPSLPDESNSNLKNERILKFSNLINELNTNPTTFTLAKIDNYIQMPEIKCCSKMIDDQIIKQLFDLASGAQDNIRQNSFFVIGSIILNFPDKIPLLFYYDIISLLSVSLSDPNEFYVSSIYFVINCLILKSSEFKQFFYKYFQFDFLVRKAYGFINSPNNDKIVECFSSITQYVGINNEIDASELFQLFTLALAKKFSQVNDRIEMNSCHFALVGIINFLNCQDIANIYKKSVVEDSNITIFLQFFFEITELKPEIINATILASQLYTLDISNMPNILPNIVRLFRFCRLDPDYDIIIHCIDIIIQIGNDQVFQQLINDLRLLDVIFEIMFESNTKTKYNIYSLFNSIICRLTPPEYVRVINNEFIGYLFNLIEINDPNFTEKLIADIFRIFQISEEIGAFEAICNVFESISAIIMIEDILQTNEISENSRSQLCYIMDKLNEKKNE